MQKKKKERLKTEEETFEGSQPGPSGVSNDGIGVLGPEDHYSNPPSVSSTPSVRSRSRSYSPPHFRSYSPTSPGSPSSPLTLITITAPTRRRVEEEDGTWSEPPQSPF